jgi:hypothetical protein
MSAKRELRPDYAVRPTLGTRISYRDGLIFLSSYGKAFPEEIGRLMNWTGTRIAELSIDGASISDIVSAIAAETGASIATIEPEIILFVEELITLGFYEVSPNSSF